MMSGGVSPPHSCVLGVCVCARSLFDCSQQFHHFVGQDTTGDEEEEMADEEDEGDEEDEDEEGEANPGRNTAVVRPAWLNTKSPMLRNASKERGKVTAPCSSHDCCHGQMVRVL